MHEEKAAVRDIRTVPFFWIQRALLDEIKPTWQGLLAYNALAYYAVGPKCREIGIPQMALKVGASQDTIRRGLKDLIAKNAIRSRERVKVKSGKRMTQPNEYTLINLGASRKQAI